MQAIEHLPAGALLVFQSVDWEEYEQVLEDLVDRPGIRVTYDRGRLEIMSPLREHEALKEFVLSLVRILAEELDVDLESCGSTTFKKKAEAKGTEPDTCFYVANAGRIIGKRTADLNVDPPPDIVVEIDVTNESSTKLPIYATFGVREIWRYNAKRKRVQICELRDKPYAEIAASLSFPVLTTDVLSGFVEQSQTQGQKRALAAFRRWIREHI
jgi:Uma2 family endonuclease